MICIGLILPPSRGRLCTAAESIASTTASKVLKVTAARRMNGKFTDMLPVKPGSFSFSREAGTAIANIARNGR